MSIATVLQVVLSIGLLNVWLLRASVPTPYRGGGARSLKEEFRAYGLSDWFFFLVGALKVGSAVLLLVGLWVSELVLPAAGLVVLMMLGALAMHVKVGDPAKKSLPALLMLAMSATLFGLQLA
ncbi:MAG: DoxX family protein [Planctomycetota bacterium]